MPCHTESPNIKWEDHLKWMLENAIKHLTPEEAQSLNAKTTEENLCKACKFLSLIQMWRIDDRSGWHSLYFWYQSHLVHDLQTIKTHLEADIAQAELSRLSVDNLRKEFEAIRDPWFMWMTEKMKKQEKDE